LLSHILEIPIKITSCKYLWCWFIKWPNHSFATGH